VSLSNNEFNNVYLIYSNIWYTSQNSNFIWNNFSILVTYIVLVYPVNAATRDVHYLAYYKTLKYIRNTLLSRKQTANKQRSALTVVRETSKYCVGLSYVFFSLFTSLNNLFISNGYWIIFTTYLAHI